MAMFDGQRYASGTAICDLAPEHRMYAGYALASLSSYYIHDLREEYAIERGGKKYERPRLSQHTQRRLACRVRETCAH